MKQYHNSHLSFIDMLFNAVCVFAALFMFSVMLMNIPQKAARKDDQRSVIEITMTWDGDSADDMDLWLKTPEPARVGFNSKESKIAHLDRDDLGKWNNYYEENGVTHYLKENKEVINIRQKMPGHYVVNVMLYSRHNDPDTKKNSTGPIEVTVVLIELDPTYREVVTRNVVLVDEFQESTAFQFDIVNGEIKNVDTISQDPFIRQAEDE